MCFQQLVLICSDYCFALNRPGCQRLKRHVQRWLRLIQMSYSKHIIITSGMRSCKVGMLTESMGSSVERFDEFLHCIKHGSVDGKSNVDLVLSCVDNYQARMTINQACNELDQVGCQCPVFFKSPLNSISHGWNPGCQRTLLLVSPLWNLWRFVEHFKAIFNSCCREEPLVFSVRPR